MRILAGLIAAFFGVLSQSFAQTETDEILDQLSKVRLDKKQIWHVRDITLRRDALSITLNRGVIAFLEPVREKVTGAVFIGSGEALAIPPDATEKQQVYKFTGLPILNETFQNAVFHFTDDTFQEIRTEILQHAEEEVTPEDIAQFETWDQTVAQRSKLLNLRFLADFVESPPPPIFLAELNGEKTGWFDILFDRRQVEEVAAFKTHDAGGKTVLDLWTSFNQRNEARNPEAVAHENKVPVEILSYDIETTLSPDLRADIKATLRLKGRIDGARVLTFDLAQSLVVTALSLESGEAVPFYQYPGTNAVMLVLPRRLTANQELTLRFSYGGSVDVHGPWYPSQAFQDSTMFNLVFHVPAGKALAATGSGSFSSAGFVAGLTAVADEDGPASIRKYLDGILGPYPFERLTVVRSPDGEPPDWPMLVQVPVNLDPPAAELMMAQRIARQWIGHRVSPASYHDEWLFEGLAQYLGAMYVESKSNDKRYLRQFLDTMRSQLMEVEDAGAIWLGKRLTSSVTPGGDRAVVTKGIWVVHMLRSLLREDGANPDSRLQQILREFVNTYQDKTASAWDFKHVAEKYLTPVADAHRDRKLDWFFDEWVMGAGVPKYELDYKIEEDGNAYVIAGTIKQSSVPEGFTMPVPVFADSEFIGRVLVGDPEAEFRFRIGKKPERVIIDLQQEVLARAEIR